MGKIITILIVIGVVIGGGYFIFVRDAVVPERGDTGSTSLGMPVPGFEGVDEMIVLSDTGERTIRYIKGGFIPSLATVGKGDTVTFVNESGNDMWIASAVHPSHKVYGGTTLRDHCGNGPDNDAFDQCGTGGSTYSFTFDKVGEWKYHNHVRSVDRGSITVIDEL